MDDIILASADLNLNYLESVKRRFSENLEMHDLGECQWFLNIRITRGDSRYMLDQSEYAKNIIIKKFSSVMGKGSVRTRIYWQRNVSSRRSRRSGSNHFSIGELLEQYCIWQYIRDLIWPKQWGYSLGLVVVVCYNSCKRD